MRILLITVAILSITAQARTRDDSKDYFWKIKPAKIEHQSVLNELGKQSTPVMVFNLHQDKVKNRKDCERYEKILMKATGKTYQCTGGQAFIEKTGER